MPAWDCRGHGTGARFGGCALVLANKLCEPPAANSRQRCCLPTGCLVAVLENRMLRWILLSLLLLLSATASARVVGPIQGWQPGTQSGQRDLADIRRSGVLRVLVNHSRNASGEIKGEVIGIEAQRLRALVQELNRDPHAKALRLKLIPTAKDQLIPALLRGEGDLVAPGERLASPPGAAVSATLPSERLVPLVIVARKGNRRYQRLEDLSGRVLVLPAGSAVPAAVARLNQRLSSQGREPLNIEMADASLAAEDVLEMVNSGLYLLTAVELPIAERWARVMPSLRVDRHMQLEDAGGTHWYLRRGASVLQARVDRFLKSYRSPADRDASFQRLYRRAYRLHNTLGQVERQRLTRVRPVLQKKAEAHGLDWLFLAALAYKESTLNPAAQGVGGASGLMQITPAAARSVGVSNIGGLEGNVEASARYLLALRRHHFAGKQMAERERRAFMLAAYNMGPQRVQSLRAEARRRGLDPDRWFFQVERVALDELGMAVPSYVSAVNKYYLAYHRERDYLGRR